MTAGTSNIRLLDFRIDEDLTEAFHNPEAWSRCMPLDMSEFMQIGEASDKLLMGKAIYMIEVFDYRRATLMVSIAIMMAVVVGMVTGLACHSAQTGVAVSECILTLTSCVEFLLVWQCNWGKRSLTYLDILVGWTTKACLLEMGLSTLDTRYIRNPRFSPKLRKSQTLLRQGRKG